MAYDNIDYTHGSQGTKPSSAHEFASGDFPKSEHFDWFWYQVAQTISNISAALDTIDSDTDGVVDEADYANDADASTYKGTDIDPDGDGLVDNEHVEALKDLAGGEAFSTYPIGSTDITSSAVTSTELALGMSPTWTGEHQFDADVDADGNSGGFVLPVGTDRWATQ